MKVLLVRHAEAVDPAVFRGDDGNRPLTRRGRAAAERLFCFLAAGVPRPDAVFSSQALRARQTAALLKKRLGGPAPVATPRLNPGATFDDFRRILKACPEQQAYIALVGHEPDLSRLLAQIISSGLVRLRMKKAAAAEVEVDHLGKGELRFLVAPFLVPEARSAAAQGLDH
jgi:phosphohistidine phosphatase